MGIFDETVVCCEKVLAKNSLLLNAVAAPPHQLYSFHVDPPLLFIVVIDKMASMMILRGICAQSMECKMVNQSINQSINNFL